MVLAFPSVRPRRLRKNFAVRKMVGEVSLSASSLIYPTFVDERIASPEPLESLPGQLKQSISSISEEVREVVSLGIPAILLFGIPREKGVDGSLAYSDNGVVQRAARTIRERVGDSVVIIADACLCMYSDHGHCGIIKDGKIDNDSTLDALGRVALSQARSGVDIIAPSGMIDGQVKRVRESLDEAGFQDVGILSYAAKFASNFYGPFRDIAESAPSFGDRTSYQLPVANVREALREIRLDINEGADVVMVKPAISYLDVVREARQAFDVPVAAYSVSGEYLMIKMLAEKGFSDERNLVMEVISSIKRAGADQIVTYFAKDVARWIRQSA